ncbi:beta-1,6-N-acetylglucosaminyltransferase [Phocaeicola salanitronis]|uniref:beta-1,6-N-acetylglucosaminyltransferase n=1 Tax=Phocaeicola salanitronis TaxID=376805 RepID=UPI0025A36242|nr:beta-1,6-N-acetylglucosaminyltransferase [Phocaeicola salanitronis]MDM8305003.1 beta-1,6-N-acetylglucosaminyltransferase [Phocaeicola salanitronis]
MKHAYLIIAHNEPEILQLLLSSLDDVRNDIYVHIDKKASFDGTMLRTVKSGLHVLPVRMDARWGDFSLVEIELLLFQEAYSHGSYAYYHLLSGVDLPVKSQDYIHRYCDEHQGKEFIGIAQHVSQRELDWRSQHWFVYSRDFQSGNLFKKIVRGVLARMQSLIGYRRTSLQVKKGSQWCSITHDFVQYLLQNKLLIRKIFNHTYCPDELFIQTLCWNSEFKNRIYNPNDEFEGCKRYIKWENGVLQPLTLQEVDAMLLSSRWFARKFTSDNKHVVMEVVKRIK